MMVWDATQTHLAKGTGSGMVLSTLSKGQRWQLLQHKDPLGNIVAYDIKFNW